MGRRFPHYQQLDQMDCGPTCLRMVAKHFGRHYTSQTLREKALIGREGVSMLGIAEAAEAIGFKSVGVKLELSMLVDQAPLPCILHWGQNHFVVLSAVSRKRSLKPRDLAAKWRGSTDSKRRDACTGYERLSFEVSDPAKGQSIYTKAEFEKQWLSFSLGNATEGTALLLEPTTRFYEEEEEKSDGLQIRQMLEYIWFYKGLVLQLCLGMLVGSGLSLLMPLLTQSVVDFGIGTHNLSFIHLILIAQMVLLCSTTATEFLRSWILLHISTRLNLTILSEFLAKLIRLPMSFFDIKQFGDIMQRIGDHHRIESFLTGQTLSILFSLFNLVLFGFVLSYYYLPIFIVALATSVLYSMWVLLFLKQRRKLDTTRFGVSARNQSQIVQLIQGMQDIKLSGAETSKRWEWERTQATLFKWNVKSLSLSQIQQAGALLINQSKNIFITFLAAKAVLDGHLTLGGMMSVQYILGQFNSPIEQLITFLQSWQDAHISLERLNEIHHLTDEEPANQERRIDWSPRQDIHLSGITYAYPGAGNAPVLKDINLTIPHGKTTAIVGTSGSGKTTLLKLLSRFYEPQQGSIYLRSPLGDNLSETNQGNSYSENNYLADNLLVSEETIIGDGIGLKTISHRAWRRQCGMVMQDGFIFSETVARNIAVADEIIDQDRLYHAAKIANIHGFIESLPLGYHTKIGAEGSGLSQGQKQRILIARSVYKNPQLLLFDEATNALDANNEFAIVRNLEIFFKGKTVVVVAHRLSTVKNADQIVVMEKGKIVEIGTHSNLVKSRGKYFELVSNQLELAV